MHIKASWFRGFLMIPLAFKCWPLAGWFLICHCLIQVVFGMSNMSNINSNSSAKGYIEIYINIRFTGCSSTNSHGHLLCLPFSLVNVSASMFHFVPVSFI